MGRSRGRVNRGLHHPMAGRAPAWGHRRVRARVSGLELASEGTGADSESTTQNPGDIARCQGHVEGIKASRSKRMGKQ